MHSAAPLRNMIKGNVSSCRSCLPAVHGGFARLLTAVCAFTVRSLSCSKDFDCIARSLSSNSLELPCMRKTHAQMKLAESEGFAEADFVALQRLLNKRS